MAFTNPAKRQEQRLDHGRLSGPRTAFLACVLAIASTWAFALGALPQDLVVPTISTGMLALAAAFAAAAWWQRGADEADVTYWDVAGAITLIGICTTALIGPEQLVRVVVGAQSEH